jgi:protein-S-isoprenylcysteine O-methyltransferase Ste14
MVLFPRLYSDRAYTEVGGAANVLKINMGNGHMEASGDQSPEPIDLRRLISKSVWTLPIFVLSLFLPAGTWRWARGWLFFVVVLAVYYPSIRYLMRVNPEVIAARINRHEGTKGWDRILVGLMIPMMISIYVVAALDDGCYHWFYVPWRVCGLGYVLFVAGWAGTVWSQSVNKFLERTVRIQTDRGQHVIDTGPYAIVRHPGYVAISLLLLGIPVALGSLWALIAAIVTILLFVVRTVLEDQALQAELSVYREYA